MITARRTEGGDKGGRRGGRAYLREQAGLDSNRKVISVGRSELCVRFGEGLTLTPGQYSKISSSHCKQGIASEEV
jgi:hypothetical protein